MISYATLGLLLFAISTVGATTVVQTATSIYPPPATATPTPTPTPSYSTSSTTCVGWECGSSSCIPKTTSLLEYICDNTCLNSSTFTYTTTTYAPHTTTMPCGYRFGKRVPEVEPEIEKRWTCVPDTTITSTTSMACRDCTQFPTLTTLTKTSFYPITTSCGQYSSSSSTKTSTKLSTKTSTTTSTKTSTKTTKTITPVSYTTGGCWLSCYDAAGHYTMIPSPTTTAIPPGYIRCVPVCA